MSEYVKTRCRVGRSRHQKSLGIGVALFVVVFLAGGLVYFAFGNSSEVENSLAEPALALPAPSLADERVEGEPPDPANANAEIPLILDRPIHEAEAPGSASSINSELRSILNKHLDALGGMARWTKVESIRLSGTIERDGQVVDIVILKKRPNKIRATVTLPIPGKEDEKLQIIRAHDGKTAWTATRLAGAQEIKREALPTEAAAKLLEDAGVLPSLIKLWHEGAELSLHDGIVTIDDHSTYMIRAKPKQSETALVFYISTKDYLLVRYESRHPTEEGLTITRPSDYRKESGVTIPMLNLIDSAATGRSIMKTESVEIGVGIPPDYFDFNSEIVTAGTR
jgi:hypothetical protein